MITWHYREFVCGHLSWKRLCEIPFDHWIVDERFKWGVRQLARQRVFDRLLYGNSVTCRQNLRSR